MEARKQTSPLLVVAAGGAAGVVLSTVLAWTVVVVAVSKDAASAMTFLSSGWGMVMNLATWLSIVLVVAGAVAGFVYAIRSTVRRVIIP